MPGVFVTDGHEISVFCHFSDRDGLTNYNSGGYAVMLAQSAREEIANERPTRARSAWQS